MGAKTYVVVTFFAVCAALERGAAQNLVVEIEGIRVPKGYVLVALFDKEEDFLSRHRYVAQLQIDGLRATAVFNGIEPGDYAVSVIHDADQNGQLNKNRLGIPTEGFGFSNNAMGTFGPPSFQKAKITVPEQPTSHTIRLRYL